MFLIASGPRRTMRRMKRTQPKNAVDLRPVLARIADGIEAVRTTVDQLADQNRWTSVAVYAELHGIHPCTVRRAAARGDLDVRRIGRRVLIRLPAPTPTKDVGR